jgi:transposase
MKNKQTIDALRLSPEEKWFLRKTIVQLHLKGFTPPQISNMLDAKLRHVQSTCKKFNDGGWKAVSYKKTGRPSGSNKILTPKQEQKIQTVIMTETPDNHKLAGFLWDMKNVLALIVLLFGIQIGRSTMATYFNRWGFSPQRPVIRAYKQSDEAVKEWLEVTYPVIKKRAHEENAEIFWGDETGVQNKCNYERGYSLKGKTPVAKVSTDKKLRINMMSAINNQGKLRFMTYEGKMNQQRLVIFLKRLIKSADKKVFIILDNLPVHHGKAILKPWLEKNKEFIEVFYLPSYSPELNPDEYFNGSLKRKIESFGNATTEKQFLNNVRAAARAIQADSAHVARLFEEKNVKYAVA